MQTTGRTPLFFTVSADHEYMLKLDIEGRGFLTVWVEEYASDTAQGRLQISENRLYETVLSESVPRQTILRRFKPLPETSFITFKIEHLGKSKVEILDASLTELQYP